LNQRPHRPERCALPGCATPRRNRGNYNRTPDFTSLFTGCGVTILNNAYHGRIRRVTYGDIFLALAILLSSIITDNKIFFAIAILEVALADGLAAVAGISYGKRWGYKVFGYTKTVIGTMVFWIVTVEILTAGVLAAHDTFSYQDYFYILLLLPPLLTILENLAIFGVDNLVIPLLTIAILQMFQT
jgi:dolichol kinase